MYFLFYAQAFDDVMKPQDLKFLKFYFLENEKSFWSEIKKHFFSFRKVSLLDLKF